MISLNNSYQDPIENEFEVGQIVEHKIYEYRGLIVEIDPSCMASEDWYRSNQTQPEKNQPWYHILVDGTHHITYVADVHRNSGGDSKVEKSRVAVCRSFTRAHYRVCVADASACW